MSIIAAHSDTSHTFLEVGSGREAGLDKQWIMATREAPEEREKGDQSSSSAPHIIRSQQATANVTTTNNFINCGQVVQLTGPNNTVIMTGNRVQLMQQTNQVQYSPPVQSRQTTTSQSTTTTTTGDPTRRCSESRDGLPIDDHNMCSVTYAQGEND